MKSLFSTMQGGCTTMQDNLKMTAAEPFRARPGCRQREGRARATVSRQDKARQGKARQGKARQGKAASVKRKAFLSRASSASTR